MATPPDFLSQVVCFGEVLWDLLPSGAKLGGAPMNVAYHLCKSGISSSMISRTGKDELGKAIQVQLGKWGIGKEYCGIDPDHATGSVIATIAANNEVHYEIVEGVAWDYIQVPSQAHSVVSASKAFVYGSLASRHEVSRNTLLALLPNATYKVFDVNLRPPFYAVSILEKLLQEADILKLNDSELRVILKLMRKAFETEEQGVSFLRSKFGINEVVLTKGNRGARYYVNDQYYEFPIVPVEVQDTVGSGDAFLAGFLAEKLRGSGPEQAMIQAVALSAFVSAREGACPVYTLDEFNIFKRDREMDLVQKMTVGQVG